MKVILGVPDTRIPVWEFGVPIMINQLFWDLVPWDNETWVDSGGYQILMRKISIDILNVLKKYKTLDAEVYMSLDIPSEPCKNMDERNIKNFEFLYSNLGKKVIPVIHGYLPSEIDKALDFYKSYSDTIAFGGIVPPSLGRVSGRRIMMLMYHYLRKKVKFIHVLGAGSPFMRKVFFNADSVDTASYRIKAVNGLVIIPGKGERYVGDRKIIWKARRASSEELEELFSFLDKTRFPFPININNWISRALINAWVMLNSEYSDDEYFLIRESRALSRLSEDELAEEIMNECMSRTRKRIRN
ncbi:MAG: hypothetical protein QXV69_08445 [Sulfolobaceae archaeon]